MKINPQHNKHFAEYERRLAELRDEQGMQNETNLRPAFQELLTPLGREVGWTFIPEYRRKGRAMDGGLCDSDRFARGYWEAKDSKDDLEVEIRQKIAAGYPLSNMLFEDTQRAVLYQGNKRVLDIANLHDHRQLADLLEAFFNYTEPEVLGFKQAVAEFKERIPDLAGALLERIRQERAQNKTFTAAFAAFHVLCKEALNPQLSAAAIEEMLVQHLLTERLFSAIFNNPDFTRRNVIAAEIEKVIDALTRRAFDRREFLKPLNRFYVAIEDAARTISDWSEKQAFMNTVYERFFQGFAVKQADTYGIVYTPQEIVDFMVASVEEVLRREFGKDLSSPGVQILDPATGTGNFLVNILQRISGSALRQKYTEGLFANEIMLLPYYIASLNIEHAYYERAGDYLAFEGICFADTLDMVTEGQPAQLPGFNPANTERIERQSAAAITVVIGNPPYNVGQVNENDNNKNRRYERLDKRVADTYVKDSKATNRNKLSDPYVKFFRWATDRLGERDGIVCFVSNNSFVDQIAFDGMRKHLLKDFTQMYHLDLHGNVRQNPKLSGTTHNVFGIQVGVGITIAVKHTKNQASFVHYARVPEYWRKEEKYAFLTEKQSIAGVEWQVLRPDERGTWLTEKMRPEFAGYLPMGSQEAKAARGVEMGAIEAMTVFKTYSLGVNTNRDDWVYDFNPDRLAAKVREMIETYNAEVSRWVRAGCPQNIDEFVLADETKIKWSSRLKEYLARKLETRFSAFGILNALYRPFTRQYLYFDSVLNHRQGLFPIIFPNAATEVENAAICVAGVGDRKGFGCLVTNLIPSLDLAFEKAQCFPFYTYAEDGSQRRENITEWALVQFRAQYGPAVGKWDIFHYVYALLHHPAYRERYAENLKRELPRIPLVPDRADFAAFVQAGKRLAALHLGYEQAEPYALRPIERRDQPFTWRVGKMRLTPDRTAVVVNDALTLAGVPEACFAYRLGNRSALEWVIDQYQVSTDARSGITSDPNREEEPEYIATLLKRVITVSLETMEIVRGLPALHPSADFNRR